LNIGISLARAVESRLVEQHDGVYRSSALGESARTVLSALYDWGRASAKDAGVRIEGEE
jgi:hypothetical protein